MSSSGFVGFLNREEVNLTLFFVGTYALLIGTVLETSRQGSHSSGKPGKLLEFCKPGKLWENSWNFMLDLEFLV